MNTLWQSFVGGSKGRQWRETELLHGLIHGAGEGVVERESFENIRRPFKFMFGTLPTCEWLFYWKLDHYKLCLHVLPLHNEWQKAQETYLNITVCMTGVNWHWQVGIYTSVEKVSLFYCYSFKPEKTFPRQLRSIANIP